ncbi:MAG TPA: hypothetical protein VHY31_04640 [Streptosporangiaceae bacterium]|nr:hypothetical protein [Streptosporangiaceae bacterium]
MARLNKDSLGARFAVFGGRRESNELMPVEYHARLPSDLEGAFFEAAVFGYGALGPRGPLASAHVHQRLTEVAGDVSCRFSALRSAEASSAVTIALYRVRQMNDLGVTFDNFYADLRAEPAATELATRREQLIQDTTLAREQQREEARRFAFLRDHFLASPQMARLWWLNNDPEKLLQLGEKTQNLENAVALLDGREADLGQGDHIAQIIETFVAELPPEHRQHLITQIGLVFRGYERADLAERLDDQYQATAYPEAS